MPRFQIYREYIYFLCVSYVNLGGVGEKVFDCIFFVFLFFTFSFPLKKDGFFAFFYCQLFF